MVQNKITGAAANRFGRETATKIANLLGLKKISNKSNEVVYNGKNAVIKSARLGNHYIGVTLKMLDRIDLVIAAFENIDGKYDLYQLDSVAFKDNLRIGHHKHIGLVQKKVFLEEGKFLLSLKVI